MCELKAIINKKIKSKDQILEYISTNELALIFFSGENCNICKVLKLKIKEEISKNFPKMKLYKIQVDLYKEIASNLSVFSIPTIIVFFNSKEFF